jgi:hypothetical protein
VRNSRALLVFAMISHTTLAAAGSTSDFEYPELMVSPSASERLQIQAKSENSESYTSHWAIQTSAATTLLAAILAGSDPGKDSASNDDEPKANKTASLAGMAVGGGWLALTGVMSAVYSPYRSGLSDLSKIKKSNKKETLAYERFAEEALATPAHVSVVMKWASFVSNAVVGSMIVSSSKNDSTKILGGLAIATSSLPLLFSHNWERTYQNQENYKKRVYGPITKNEFSLGTHHDSVAAIFTTSTIF